MLGLKRLLLGDHPFALSSRDFNFYRDFALIWPLFVFSAAAFTYLSTPAPIAGERSLGYKFLAAALVTLFLAKEKLVVIAGLVGWLGVCFVNPMLPVVRDWRAIIGAGVCFGLVWLITKIPGFKPSYEWPNDLGFWEGIIFIASLCGSLWIAWIARLS
jgi:hypothetical protein